MAPMLEKTSKNLEAVGSEKPLEGKKVSADTGYYHVENLEACEDEKVDAYVPDQQFRKRDVHLLKEKRTPSITDKMREKIDTPEGRKTCSKRIGIVEPVFGNIRSCNKMDRITLRGKVKVSIQWMLYCLVRNIEKILDYGESFATIA